jgi:hypothetical protein
MKSKTRSSINKSAFLTRIDKVWGLHTGAGRFHATIGCLAFEIDERFVREDGIEYRYAVSYGEDCSFPRLGAMVFGGLVIASRRRSVAVVGYGNAESAEPGLNIAQATSVARRILDRIPDEDYPRLVLEAPKTTTLVRRASPAAIRSFELKPFGFLLGDRRKEGGDVIGGPPCSP